MKKSIILTVLCIILLSSCGESYKEYTFLYKRTHTLYSKKCSCIVRAKDRADAVIKFKISNYTSNDSIIIDSIYLNN